MESVRCITSSAANARLLDGDDEVERHLELSQVRECALGVDQCPDIPEGRWCSANTVGHWAGVGVDKPGFFGEIQARGRCQVGGAVVNRDFGGDEWSVGGVQVCRADDGTGDVGAGIKEAEIPGGFLGSGNSGPQPGGELIFGEPFSREMLKD